jgi:hypothetical protein
MQLIDEAASRFCIEAQRSTRTAFGRCQGESVESVEE